LLDGALIRPPARDLYKTEGAELDMSSATIVSDGQADIESEPGYATLDETLDLAIAKRLKEAIERAHGNRSEAAKMLGLNRTKFYRLLRRIEQQQPR
jgi:DNA-binding NtrC family response regulator